MMKPEFIGIVTSVLWDVCVCVCARARTSSHHLYFTLGAGGISLESGDDQHVVRTTSHMTSAVVYSEPWAGGLLK